MTTKTHGDLAVSSIVRSGDKLTVPEPMTLPAARDIIDKQIKYEGEVVAVNEEIKAGLYWDGAWAFYRAMASEFGWVFQAPTPGMFGPQPPSIVSIESGVGETVSIPHGRFIIPQLQPKPANGVTTFLQSGHSEDSRGRIIFTIQGQVLRRDEPMVKRVAEKTRQLLAESSLYRGKAVRIRFEDDDGETVGMPQPSFLDVRKATPESLILPADVHEQVETSIFTPVRYTDAVREAKIPLKRGVLLSGPYGTGKTLTAYVTANLAQANGWTFVYCERASELEAAVRFGMNYSPAVVFCEDIDREMSGGRSAEMDDILNVIDGIESKQSELMVILTTNHVEKLNKALLRQGRLDAVIEFKAPDAQAAIQLVRLYGRSLIEKGADLSEVGSVLAGRIPAAIRETVERAKLSAIKLTAGEKGKLVLTPAALLDAAHGMVAHLELLAEEGHVETAEEKLFAGMRAAAQSKVDLPRVERNVRDIHREMGLD